MDFRDLSYVLAIAKYQNITKAADALYITQPTLTKFLQSLEHQMGQKLFRKLGLNPHQTEVLTGDNEQQQQLEQQIFNADTDQFYNAAAV